MGRSPADLVIFILKRLVQLIPVLIGIIVLTFVFTHLSVANCAIWYPHASKSTLANCQAQFSQPLLNQFLTYFGNLLKGNWGASVAGVAVYPAIATGVPATLELVLRLAVPDDRDRHSSRGHRRPVRPGGWGDHLVRIFYLTGWATPTYLGAVIAAIFLAPYFGLPSHGEFTSNPPPFTQWTHLSVLDALPRREMPAGRWTRSSTSFYRPRSSRSSTWGSPRG